MKQRYDDRTTAAIAQFIDDVMHLFPGLFTSEELWQRIIDKLRDRRGCSIIIALLHFGSLLIKNTLWI